MTTEEGLRVPSTSVSLSKTLKTTVDPMVTVAGTSSRATGASFTGVTEMFTVPGRDVLAALLAMVYWKLSSVVSEPLWV